MKTGEPFNADMQKQPPEPYQQLNDFFERYALWECQAELWRLLSAALSSDDADYWDKHDRGNAVFFCKNMDDVLKALYAVQADLVKNNKT